MQWWVLCARIIVDHSSLISDLINTLCRYLLSRCTFRGFYSLRLFLWNYQTQPKYKLGSTSTFSICNWGLLTITTSSSPSPPTITANHYHPPSLTTITTHYHSHHHHQLSPHTITNHHDHPSSPPTITNHNKHKFVPKVAKKKILFICFFFSARLSFVHSMGFYNIKFRKYYNFMAPSCKLEESKMEPSVATQQNTAKQKSYTTTNTKQQDTKYNRPQKTITTKQKHKRTKNETRKIEYTTKHKTQNPTKHKHSKTKQFFWQT